MEYGIFMMPSHPPEREVFQAHQWDLDCLVLADKLGFSEAWIGEHYTALWEPVPSPDLMIAQSLRIMSIASRVISRCWPFMPSTSNMV